MAILNIDQWLDGSKVFKNRIGAVGIDGESDFAALDRPILGGGRLVGH